MDEYDDNIVDKEFVRRRRVEIDAVLSQVGGERLWEFIQYRLVKLHLTRVCNRAIEMPAVETLYPKPIQDMMVIIHEHIIKSIEDKEHEIMESLSTTEGMINIKDKEQEIQDELQEVVDNDKDIRKIVSVIEKVLEDLES